MALLEVRSQMKEVITMLQKHKSKDVAFIGIWGMGGIGKTTMAKFVFEHIQKEFESTCFLSNVREDWKRDGQVYVQRKLLSEICEEATDTRIDNIECHRKVLVVLDDVNYLEQLHALCGSRKLFGEGSRIIITTRDSQLLKAFQVDDVYSMKLLSHHESLKIFIRKAFQQASPPEGKFMELSKRVVDFAEGLPLALEALGSALYEQSLMKWESELMKLSIIPPLGIYSKLKHSFDSLDGNEKEIFLNIVFFYIGEDKNDVIQKLDARGCNASIGIRALVDQSLLTIDNNKFRMHRMLQLMGRQIIRQSPQNELLKQGYKYEVFLSFRGEDTRAAFTSHLYKDLCKAGIVVFKDDVELPRGGHIKTELLQAIGSSKIAIIIFSKEYAGSKWCLEELSTIMEFNKSNDQVVLPVFYDVQPREVRNQTSSFGKAFARLIQKVSPPRFQFYKWCTALREAGRIDGTNVVGSRDEGEIVTALVKDVCDILDKKDLFVADHPVGVDNRVQEVIAMLQNHQSEDVVMVGIWGMGGTGKTTIAKAIYNEIGCKFESRSYLPKIRKAWHHRKGKVGLQNQLLSDICKTTKIKINSIESGKITLKYRLRHRKVLVVLDDVDKLAQLNALIGSRDWFKSGSIIIITTRNKRLLLQKDCRVYVMKNLDKRESLELFSWHAFKQESPKKDFIEISRDMVAYSGGLPLALEVLGSCLFGGEVEEWKSVLERLKKIPFEKIQKKLKKSFDGLSNPSEKKVFLDISCFFIGMDKNDVTHILNSRRFSAKIGIKTLMEQSLVTIDEKNMLGMHDLLRDMGREIIRQQSPKLGERSRLWFHKDARAVLLKYRGTKVVEGLSMELSKSKEKHFRTEAFEKMKKLRLLHLKNVQLKGDYEYISRYLKWLCWHGFPLEYIPSNFYQQKLVAMELKNSSLVQVWKKPQLLKRLKILNLSYSLYLAQTPDFSQLPNLEKLILKYCLKLSMIDDSIGLLDKLHLLDLEDCIGLRSLPISIYSLRLETLVLAGCLNIKNLEEVKEKMESLTTLITAHTIKQVPFFLVRSNSLLLEDRLEIPDSLCTTNCMDISTLENCLEHLLIQFGKDSQVFHILSNKISQRLKNLTKHGDHDCVLPDDNYPYWLTFKGDGDCVRFKVPPFNSRDHLKGMSICCVYFSPCDFGNKPCESCIVSLMIINYTKKNTFVYTEDKNSLERADQRKEGLSNLEPYDQMEVKVLFRNGFIVKKMAVYLIYRESFDEQTEPSISKPGYLIGIKHKYDDEEEEAHQSTRHGKAMKI